MRFPACREASKPLRLSGKELIIFRDLSASQPATCLRFELRFRFQILSLAWSPRLNAFILRANQVQVRGRNSILTAHQHNDSRDSPKPISDSLLFLPKWQPSHHPKKPIFRTPIASPVPSRPVTNNSQSRLGIARGPSLAITLQSWPQTGFSQTFRERMRFSEKHPCTR